MDRWIVLFSGGDVLGLVTIKVCAKPASSFMMHDNIFSFSIRRTHKMDLVKAVLYSSS
jgi:hypothetical protein